MIPKAKYCKKHRKHHNPKDECPVCEAVRVLKGEDYEREIEHIEHNQNCESSGVCGGRCSHKGCS